MGKQRVWRPIRGYPRTRILRGADNGNQPAVLPSLETMVVRCIRELYAISDIMTLAADKPLVLRDAFRVLKPGGRFAVSDVVADGPAPEALRQNMDAWVGCLAGALKVDAYKALLTQAGFDDVSVEITRRYTATEAGRDPSTLPAGRAAGDGTLASAFVRATKPAAGRTAPQPAPVIAGEQRCRGPECCAS